MKDLKKFHEIAAKHFEKAAEHHLSAALNAANGDHESAAMLAYVAQGHALQAHEHAALAIKRNVALQEHREEEEVE